MAEVSDTIQNLSKRDETLVSFERAQTSREPEQNASNLADYIVTFLEYCQIEKGLSPLTVRNYKQYLFDFMAFSGISAVSAINPNIVWQYRLDLSNRKLNKNTQSYYLIALRSFLKFLAKRGIKSLHPEQIDLPKKEGRQIKFLEREKLYRMLEAPNVLNPVGLRDRTILETLFSTGLRVSELVSLNCDQINFKTSEISVIGKGRKVRVVFLSDRAKHWLKQYFSILKWGTLSHKPLFVSSRLLKSWHTEKLADQQPEGLPQASLRVDSQQDSNIPLSPTPVLNVTAPDESRRSPAQPDEGGRLSTRQIERLVKKYAKAVGLAESPTPHWLRHSFATDLLSSGADLRSVQEMLGHQSVQTTQIYTHVTNRQLKDVHRAFHAGNK